MIGHAKYIFQFIFLLLLLSACNSTKFLQDDEYLMRGNTLKLKTEGKIENKRLLLDELPGYYRQRKNSKFLFFFPREWFYYKTSAPGDTTKLDRFIRRSIAEKPTIYDEQLTRETAENMEHYLRSKGFLEAEVQAEDDINKKGNKAWVTYYVYPNKQYHVDSVAFSSPDPTIDSMLQSVENETLFQPGSPLDLGLYEQERQRITNFLRNNGYAYYYGNYFDQVEVDTIGKKREGSVYFSVLPPFGDSSHHRYRIGEVRILPDYDAGARDSLVQIDTIIDGYRFLLKDREFAVRPQTLIKAMYLRPGEIFSEQNYQRTSRQLSALGIFRFWRIKPVPDEDDPNLLHYRIELTPNYKMELGADFEVNYTNRSTSGAGNLIGFAINPSFRNRNLLGGGETLITNFSTGVEMNFSERSRFWNTVDLRLQTELFFPRFRDYLGFWNLFNAQPIGKKSRAEPESFYNQWVENAATRLSLSYNYLLIIDWYRYNLFNATYGYDLQRTSTKRYLMNHVGVDLLIPQTEPQFDTLLQDNPFLRNSFGQQLFVSLLFRDFNYVYNGRPNRYNESNYFSFSVEMAGAELWAANKAYNQLAGKNDIWRLSDTINFSQYARFEMDYRYYKQFSTKRSFASRFNFGIARPFGFTTDVPYVKQFYVGGPNSIRAWAPRGLGPGGYQDPNALDRDNNFRLYQTGDLKLEFNMEYRFEILWQMKGAFFLDAGNIWTIEEDPDRCGSQFLFSRADRGEGCYNDPFYKQIAIGGGFGLRFDFSYFIFRLDMGVKLRNSYPRIRDVFGNAQERSYWESLNGFGLSKVAFNFGLGYPF